MRSSSQRNGNITSFKFHTHSLFFPSHTCNVQPRPMFEVNITCGNKTSWTSLCIKDFPLLSRIVLFAQFVKVIGINQHTTSSTCSSGQCPNHQVFTEDRQQLSFVKCKATVSKPHHVNIKPSESQWTAAEPLLYSWLFAIGENHLKTATDDAAVIVHYPWWAHWMTNGRKS